MVRITVVAVMLALAGSAVPAYAGGWGHGPSWGQAKKIIHQAGTDIGNGAKAIAKPSVLAAVGAVATVGVCAATAGACAAALPALP